MKVIGAGRDFHSFEGNLMVPPRGPLPSMKMKGNPPHHSPMTIPAWG
jgi:hypothetical protein